ncbi:cell wall-binding repeat-containing protein [Guptibacillus hwajinpoensis]|uniref:cell wall-binding repeat-containing protein n=1 Tax=Guptibacillus hwajinpoensis TaxID=208199 RepID=UPI001CD63EAC|nr:cell wall-binding repeat-containing protein [Pseudalkalibacillus hwajinpoensis]MCA0991273.1 cell wall-binding repeat-containing protein [Pseudalkalibacillus hwajinpoensis]
MLKKMLKITNSFLLSMLVLLGSSPFYLNEISAEENEVEVWLTTADGSKKLEKQENIPLLINENSPSSKNTINVNEEKKYQEMDGFGAAISGASAHVLSNLDPERRKAILKDLFTDQGINLSFLRMTIGSSDFSLDRYTYNDMPIGETDEDLNHFSIEKDQEVVSILQQVLTQKENVKIMGSPWSPPAWMKVGNSLNGGTLDPIYYNSYASYLAKYINAFEEQGIPIYAITPQNEPLHEATGNDTQYGYPSMKMTAAEQVKFIKNSLGPTFEEKEIDTKIIAYDHNWDKPEYPVEVLNDDEARKYIAGSAFHAYAGNPKVQSNVHDQYPEKGIWFTEISGGEWSTNFGDNLAWNMKNIIVGATRNWSKSVLFWNLALNENHGPTTPSDEDGKTETSGCKDCRGVVTIDSKTGEITKNVEYYILGHVSKFVKPGANRIQSSDISEQSNIENVAFINPDGSKVMLAMNTSDRDKEIKVNWGEKSFLYTLKAGSAATFNWSGEQTGDQVIPALSKIEAESYDKSNKDLRIEVTSDVGGGEFITGVAKGDYIAFNQVDFLEAIHSVQVRVATEKASSLDLRVGSHEGYSIGKVPINPTGSENTWETITVPVDITGVTGTQKLYVVFEEPVNMNWFRFSTDFFQDSLNYIKNPSLETGSFESWSETHPDGQELSQSVSSEEAKDGNHKIDHWSSGDYKQATYQTVQVPNGTYKFSVWVRSSGDQNQLTLQAKGHGSSMKTKEIGSTGVGTWTKYTIENIHVSTGEITVGVFSDANGGNWANFDEFSLHRVSKEVPTQGTNDLLAPNHVEVTQSNQVELSWDQVKGARGYSVYQATIVNGKSSPYIERTFTDETTFIDSGLKMGTTYSYKITTVDDQGESLPSEPVHIKPEKVDVNPPATPTDLRGIAQEESILLKWNNNTDLDFQAYHVYQNGKMVASISPITETSKSISNLQGEKNYSFSISAIDLYGNESKLSEPISLSPLSKGKPITIENLDFESGDLSHWNEWHPANQESAHKVDNDYPLEGNYKLTHNLAENYEQYTYRTVEVPNGKYKVSVSVRSGIEKLELQVKNYGGEEKKQLMKSPSWDKWTKFSIDQIEVTNGQLEFGVYSKTGNNTGWAAIDGFEIISYEKTQPGEPVRLSGSDRYETAVEISKEGWEKADTVILARGDEFADALAGVPYAYQLEAPILLTGKDKLTSSTKKEIQRLSPEKVIILGGEGVVSDYVVYQLRGMGVKVDRIGGHDRFETAANISARMGDSEKAIVVNGLDFPDALSAGAYAAEKGYPILFTMKEKLPNETEKVLKSKESTIVVGGTGVVSDKVAQHLPKPTRYSGKDRFGTAAKVATELNPSNHVFVATGMDFADALAGSVLAARQEATVLLVQPDKLPETTKEAVGMLKANEFTILGGTGAVSEQVVKEMMAR